MRHYPGDITPCVVIPGDSQRESQAEIRNRNEPPVMRLAVRHFVEGLRRAATMSSRADILEALHHLTDTRARLAKQPGTHRARHDLIVVADRLLDELSLIEEGETWLKSSPSLV